jgi:hypothetical protein
MSEKIPINMVITALLLTVGCSVIAGCIAQSNNDDATAVVPTFAPFSINASGNSTTGLDGTLIVSINGYPKNLAVVLDNKPVGTVKPTTPLFLKVPEGNHTVMVCVGWICENENVTIRFGKQVNVDFNERLRKDVEFPDPTARILEYYKNGNGISVNVEFLNPDAVDHTISLDISAGYSYIDDKTHVKLGDSARVKKSLFIKAGQRETQRVDLHFTSSGSSISFSYPQIEDLTVK